jgi:hypothetical protein
MDANDRAALERIDWDGTPASKPSGHRPAPPATASPQLLRHLRTLDFSIEARQRLIRRCRLRRDVRLGGPVGPPGEWNERNIDCRLRSGDPVAICDAMRDTAEAPIDAAHKLEIDMGLFDEM